MGAVEGHVRLRQLQQQVYFVSGTRLGIPKTDTDTALVLRTRIHTHTTHTDTRTHTLARVHVRNTCTHTHTHHNTHTNQQTTKRPRVINGTTRANRKQTFTQLESGQGTRLTPSFPDPHPHPIEKVRGKRERKKKKKVCPATRHEILNLDKKL